MLFEFWYKQKKAVNIVHVLLSNEDWFQLKSVFIAQ